MQTLRQYLAAHYVDLEHLASVTSVRAEQIEALIAEKLVPAPSYVVTAERKLISCVFGEFESEEVAEGQYFHRLGHVWVTAAKEARDRLDVSEAREELRKRFKTNFTQALLEINESLVRLPDTFSESGESNWSRLDQRFEEAWEALIEGVYNLCVADPSNERSIARKEMLQEHLQRVSERIAVGESLERNECDRMLQLIDQYAQAAMPFAPPEYPRSSRKRLVEDLPATLRQILSTT